MKILHINDHYRDLGGAERYLLDTCAALEELGHKVIIIASVEGERVHYPGRQEYFVEPSWGIRSGRGRLNIYRDIIKREDPDVVHIHNTYDLMSPVIIRDIHKMKPTVRFVHDIRLICPNKRKIIEKTDSLCPFKAGLHCLRQGCISFPEDRGAGFVRETALFFYHLRIHRGLDKMIVGSRYMNDELIRNGFKKERVAIVPCYTERGKGESVGEEDQNLILCIGRFDGVKGIPQFIQSLALVRDKRWMAEIVGDEGCKEEAIYLAKGLGIERRVRFLGRLSSEELDHRYRAASLVIMPSMIPESFGIVGIEAMAFGKPVIAFDSGGVRDWLSDHETGILVKRGDTVGLARTIDRLLQDKGMARKMGKLGKERVEALYRKKRHLDSLIEIYQEAVRGRKGGPQ